MQASILLADEIESNLDYLIKTKNEESIALLVHPYLEAYFKTGLISRQMKWLFKYKKWIPVRGLSSQNLLQYSFVNKNKEEITL